VSSVQVRHARHTRYVRCSGRGLTRLVPRQSRWPARPMARCPAAGARPTARPSAGRSGRSWRGTGCCCAPSPTSVRPLHLALPPAPPPRALRTLGCWAVTRVRRTQRLGTPQRTREEASATCMSMPMSEDASTCTSREACPGCQMRPCIGSHSSVGRAATRRNAAPPCVLSLPVVAAAPQWASWRRAGGSWSRWRTSRGTTGGPRSATSRSASGPGTPAATRRTSSAASSRTPPRRRRRWASKSAACRRARIRRRRPRSARCQTSRAHRPWLVAPLQRGVQNQLLPQDCLTDCCHGGACPADRPGLSRQTG